MIRARSTGLHSSLIGIVLYILVNACYTVAVFTDPGSPTTRTRGRGQYSHLPTTEPPKYRSYMVSSSGKPRFCKKCQYPKPDRTHHCSTCKRCVLKMDHHCPWLATCVGLRNYKAFLLFLIYTSLFCWVCFSTASIWVWSEVLADTRYIETMLPVNVVLLAVFAGIIGLVLTAFTLWHISLAVRNLTTIESLEKTRYLSPLREVLDRHRNETFSGHERGHEGDSENNSLGQILQGYGQQIIDAHANAIPGVTRAEEGEERSSPAPRSQQEYPSGLESHATGTPAQQALRRSYHELESQRELRQYEEYLETKHSESMPNPYDHGWRNNLRHLFGENPWLWALPVCNTIGDGWHWEPSREFLETREKIRLERERELNEWLQRQRQYNHDYWFNFQGDEHGQPMYASQSLPINHGGGLRHQPQLSHAGSYDRPSTGVSMKTLRPMSPRRHDDSDYYDSSSDEEPRGRQPNRW